MRCKLCGSDHVKSIYDGFIRDGGLGNYTKGTVTMLQCEDCDVIWHEAVIGDSKKYYETKEYRNSLEGCSNAETFYRLHDREILDKFQYTGTDIFRNKVVADIGCGCEGFLDFLKGVAGTIVAIGPSEIYRKVMAERKRTTVGY